jgi:hypothetical protein
LQAIGETAATRLRRPAQGNGLFLALATPELNKAGSDVDLSLDAAADNQPDPGGADLSEPELPAGPSCALPAIELEGSGYHTLALPQLPAEPVDPASFWVIRAGVLPPTGQAYNETEVGVKRVAVGEHCRIYLDGQVSEGEAREGVDALLEAFEQKIYPAATQAFGAPPALPVSIVLSPQVSALGKTAVQAYFARRDMHPRVSGIASRVHSNQRPVLYVDSYALAPERRLNLLATVAHEFQHLINYGAKLKANVAGEQRFLDEALAMYSSEVCGYGPTVASGMYQHVAAYLQRPYKYSLTDWTGNPGAQGYGIGYLFIAYLADRFGPELIRELVDSPVLGKNNLDVALMRRGSSYKQAFGDWAVVLATDGFIQTGDPRFSYHERRLRLKTDFGELKGPAAIRLGPNGAHLPRRADVAFLFHFKPGPGDGDLVLRGKGGPFQAMALIP